MKTNKRVKTNRRKFKEKLKNGSLAEKITLAVGTMITGALIVLIGVSTIMAGYSLSTTVNGELSEMSAKNGQMVQEVINIAASTATDMQYYMNGEYEDFNGVYEGTPSESQVYKGQMLEALNIEIENYILHTAWSTIEGSEYIVGVGVFMEPGAMDPNLETYAVYADTEDAKNKTARAIAYEQYKDKLYYTGSKETQKNTFTDPYESNGIMMISAGFPIVFEGETMGVVVVDIDVTTFGKLDMTDEKYPTLYGVVNNSRGMHVHHSKEPELVGTDMAERYSKKSEYNAIMEKMKGDKPFSITTTKGFGNKVIRYCYPVDAAGKTWWVQSVIERRDMNKALYLMMAIMIALAIAALIVIRIYMKKIIYKSLSPMKGVVDAAEQLALYNFDIELEVAGEDEIGHLTQSFANTIASLRAVVNDLNRGLSIMATGDFDIAPEVEYIGAMAGIKEALGKFIEDMTVTLSQINDSSEQVAGSADQIAQGAQSLTEGAAEQASSIEVLQNTITSVSADVDVNAKNAETANEMARSVGNEINASNEQMQKMVEAMNLITETSNQINNIISTINDIAAQTNLLALNASIEAARAGEMGKGFAIVAGEVGNLAAQSAEAAKNSTELIADAIRAVENGKVLADTTAVKLAESAEKTQELVKNIGNISEASVKQAEALDRVAMDVQQIVAVIQQNTAMAEESSASSQEMAGQAQLLKELVGRFKYKKD